MVVGLRPGGERGSPARRSGVFKKKQASGGKLTSWNNGLGMAMALPSLPILTPRAYRLLILTPGGGDGDCVEGFGGGVWLALSLLSVLHPLNKKGERSHVRGRGRGGADGPYPVWGHPFKLRRVAAVAR